MVSINISPSGKKLPCSRVFFSRMKIAVLGKKYELSVAFVGPKKMQKFNRIYRGKNKPTDILSFPVSKDSGEILMSLSEVRKQARLFNRSYGNFLLYLLIHGLLHLKGFAHGSRMDREEEKFRKKFNI